MKRGSEGGTAVRHDVRLSTVETATFLGGVHPPPFGCRHEPAGPAKAAVVLCPSLYFDLTQGYRREVLLARRLAARGFVVQRFHYRGSGHSAGEPAAITVERMVEDALVAAEHVASPGLPVCWVGTRWGALVAAEAARLSGSDGPLVAWEPVLEPAAFYLEALRAKIAGDWQAGTGVRRSAKDLLAELEGTGVVEVLGFELHRALHESARGRSFAAALGEASRDVLLVSLSGGAATTRQSAVADDLRDRGHRVDLVERRCQTSWWFFHDVVDAGNPVRLTARWLAARVPAGAAA